MENNISVNLYKDSLIKLEKEYSELKKEYETNLNAFSSAGVRESTKTPHPGVSLLDKYPPKVK